MSFQMSSIWKVQENQPVIVQQGNQKPTNILKTQNKVIAKYEKVKSKKILLTMGRTRYLRKKIESLQILDEGKHF